MGQDELGPEVIVRVFDPETGTRGVLVIDNTINGPAGGGTRMVGDLTEAEVAELARAMTYKWAIFDLPSGGTKAGIFANPNMPVPNKQAVLQAFGRGLRPYLSNADFLFGIGPDMGMEGHDVEEIYRGACATNVVTWEASEKWIIDGDPASFHLTGRGVVAAAKAAMASVRQPIAGATFAIEGFGQVGAGTARYLEREGARVTAVTTVLGGIHDPAGLDIGRLLELRREHGDACIGEYGRGERIPTEQLFSIPVDVLVPGARPRAIDAFNEGAVRARFICPAGNLSVTESAEDQLHRRGIIVVPDFVVNSGGIIATWVNVVGGNAKQALATVGRLVEQVTTSVLAEARESNMAPGATARARVRKKILATKRRKIRFEEARAEAKRVLRLDA